MESRDFVYLQEAYQEIYQLDEEVEIATEYFYEMGLNEYGVNALIEELGVEEFVEWVYDIAESYTLEEETRLQRMSGRKNKILTGPKGSRPQSTTKAREKKQGGVTMRTSSGPKSTIRKRAARAAAETQPETREEPTKTKKGIAGAIEYAKKRAAADTELLRQGMRNLASSPAARGAATAAAALRAGGEFAHRAGQKAAETETGKKVKKTLGKAALAAAGAAGAGVGSLKVGKSPAAAAGRAVGTFLRKMRAEDVEFVDWVENLWEEGYDLSDYTWEGLYEAYIEEARVDSNLTPLQKIRKRNKEYFKDTPETVQKTTQRRVERESVRGVKRERGAKSAFGTMRHVGGPYNEEVDAYNIIADYLLDEGYAHDFESADAIIASMSEDWIDAILNEAPFDVYRGSTTVDNTKVGSKSPVKVNKTPYKTRKGANRAADRLNQEYGAGIHTVVRTPENR